jgi:hypothetical protein
MVKFGVNFGSKRGRFASKMGQKWVKNGQKCDFSVSGSKNGQKLIKNDEKMVKNAKKSCFLRKNRHFSQKCEKRLTGVAIKRGRTVSGGGRS